MQKTVVRLLGLFLLCVELIWIVPNKTYFIEVSTVVAAESDEDYDYEEFYEEDSQEEDADHDYEEIYEDTEETSGDTGNTVAVPSSGDNTVNGTTGNSHVLDNTPKTADYEVHTEYIFCMALFLSGLALLLYTRRWK